jgi:hypothetical protein
MMRPSALAGLFFILCVVTSCDDKAKSGSESGKITWSGHIAPIIYENCTPCHRPEQSGSFDLLSYHDAKKRGSQIRLVTSTRNMPPWPADPTYSHFIGERWLSDSDIDLIGQWVQDGMPRGDSTREPAPPAYFTGSYFGKPDLVIRAQQPVQIKGNGTDRFLIMKYPYRLERDTFADFFEFVPHRRKLVHHVNGHLISYDAGRKFDYFKGEAIHESASGNVVDVFTKMGIPYSDGKQPEFPAMTPNTVYYLPGYIPPAYPEEIGGYRLKKDGLILLNNIHYGPSNADLTDSSHINVFFRAARVTRPIAEAQLGTFGLSRTEPDFVIPPGEIKTFHTQFTLPSTISMLSVNPHMHLLGTKYLAYAIRPGGDTVRIIRINKWDFRWQYYYTFKHPLKLEAGTTIHVFGTYDNTSKNINNPFFPPRTITQGNGVESMKTTEEMFQFIYTYVPYKVGDEGIDLEREDH